MTPAPCRLLDWDTNFWGVRVARVEGDRLDESRLAEIDEWCAAEKISCAYFLATAEDPATTYTAERGGFFYTDTRLTVDAPLDRLRAAPGSAQVRAFETRDLAAVREIARVSHRVTRFYRDPHFPDERCDELYAEWVTEQCRSDPRGAFVAEMDDRAVGYVTCSVDEERIGRVGLIGVAPDYRNKGVAQGLAAAAFRVFGEGHAAESVVYTQMHNISAVRLFTRVGYLAKQVELWFHKWYDR